MKIDAKIQSKVLANWIQQYIKKNAPWYIIWPRLIFSINARMFQYPQINQCDIPH